jgi:hypothetical protein
VVVVAKSFYTSRQLFLLYPLLQAKFVVCSLQTSLLWVIRFGVTRPLLALLLLGWPWPSTRVTVVGSAGLWLGQPPWLPPPCRSCQITPKSGELLGLTCFSFIWQMMPWLAASTIGLLGNCGAFFWYCNVLLGGVVDLVLWYINYSAYEKIEPLTSFCVCLVAIEVHSLD